MKGYDIALARLRQRYGAAFRDDGLSGAALDTYRLLVGRRVKLRFPGGEVRAGTIDLHDGPAPHFILKAKHTSHGGTILDGDEEVVAIRTGNHYYPPDTAAARGASHAGSGGRTPGD